jgi:hypothetical protein
MKVVRWIHHAKVGCTDELVEAIKSYRVRTPQVATRGAGLLA